MSRLLLSGVFLTVPLAAQWTVWDPSNYGINLSNLRQAQQAYQQMQQYKQMFDNASAFMRNPAQFMAQIASVEQMALNTANSAGVSTQQKRDQLQKIIRAQQEAMRQAQTIQTISHQNMSSIDNLANSLMNSSEQLARVNQQLAEEQRTMYYRRQERYVNQGDVVAHWRP